MKTLLGVVEMVLFIWGAIAFWGTPWSICTLIILVLVVGYAVYSTGKIKGKTEIAKGIINNALDQAEQEESKFKSFFKKENEDKED